MSSLTYFHKALVDCSNRWYLCLWLWLPSGFLFKKH